MINTVMKNNRVAIFVGSLTLLLVMALLLASLMPPMAQADTPTLYSVSKENGILHTVNPLTGLVGPASPVPITLAGESVGGATGLAQDPTTCLLYAILKIGGSNRSGR